MGWLAISKNLEKFWEDDGVHGRPVDAGEEGKLLIIAQEDFGHKVAVHLLTGTIFLDYENIEIQNGTVDIQNDKVRFVICDETNIAGDFAELTQELVYLRDDYGRKVLLNDGRFAQVRNDILTPLLWRPIWFTRWTNGMPTKVIGAQTTLPKEQGGKNVKKMISIFADGRLGID